MRGQAAITPQANAAAAEPPTALPTLPAWRISSSIEAAYGYKDNLLLSHAEEARSAFARGRAQLFVMGVPPGPFDYSFFGEVGGSRYFSPIAIVNDAGDRETVDHDARAWLNFEPGYSIGEHLKFSLPFAGYYRDEVFDVSLTDVKREVRPLKVWGGSVSPTLHWTIHPAWWLEASATGDRRRYDDDSDNSRIGGGQLRLGWKPVSWLATRLTTARRWRGYDTRVQYNSGGFPQNNTQLKIAEREAELRFDITWDKAETWKTTTRIGRLDNRDNGSGYFSYRVKSAGQELTWETKHWLAEIEATANRSDFDVQKAGLGSDPPARLKDGYTGSARLERVLSEKWTIFAVYTWERRRSNDEIESYVVNEGLLGLRWSWVK